MNISKKQIEVNSDLRFWFFYMQISLSTVMNVLKEGYVSSSCSEN